MAQFTYLSGEEVFELSAGADVEGAIGEALVQALRGEAGQRIRTEMAPDPLNSVLGIMPAFKAGGDHPLYSAKVVCVVPENPRHGLPAHQGFAMLFDAARGTPLLLADAATITEIRTAALTALATRTLASPLGKSLVVGSGHQARAHARALAKLGHDLSIWARDSAAARELSGELVAQGIRIAVEDDLKRAVESATVVTTVTGSPEPLILGEWLMPGAHVNAIGSSTPRVCELGEDIMRSARIFADDVDAVSALSGEIQRLENPPEEIVPLATVLGADASTRERGEVTVFKSVGVPLQDLALLELLWQRLDRLSSRQRIEL